MSIIPEVTSDEWEKDSKNRLLEQEVKTKRINKLETDIKNTREKISLLMKERKSQGIKLVEFKELNLTAKSNSKIMIKKHKSGLNSLEERLKVKEMQTKEIWSAFQTLDDADVMLKLMRKSGLTARRR